MKKILGLVKPFIAIGFGALIIMLYLNRMSVGGNETVKSVFAFIVGSYFIVIGLLGMICAEQIGEKPLRILNAIGFSVYASFFFLVTLLDLVDLHDGFGVNGWVVANFTLTVALGFAVLNIIQIFVDNRIFGRITNILGLLFVLALVFDILFDEVGDPVFLGMVQILLVLVHVTYISIYLGNIKE